MAMPVATGIAGTRSRLSTAATTASSLPSALTSASNTNTKPSVRTEAEANHLICWRSSPLARWNRTNSETTAASPATSIIGNPANSTTTNSTWDGPSSAGPSCRTNAGPLSGQRKRTGLCEERVGGVLVAGDREPLEEGGGAEDPTYGILGAVRGDEGPDDGERHRQGSDRDYALLDEDLTRRAPVEESEDQARRGQRHTQQTKRP